MHMDIVAKKAAAIPRDEHENEVYLAMFLLE
jgi:hypothetical protein